MRLEVMADRSGAPPVRQRAPAISSANSSLNFRSLHAPQRHFSGEYAVGLMKTFSTFATSGPSFSEASLAAIHAGSSKNDFQAGPAASQLGCASMYISVS